ncbi:hypothetical protein [Mycobacterium paraffinicum]|uniref:Mammalian cell entry protein n=1 Tax=Mycobacterium paraffinicum TaxID=53378 RepID=A0ABP8RJI0_9MYCO|nr:hypothetical protein [Mycobacterium paraffinicum]MCV7309998.1 hypothetical protein [Mycobacterium paraffinicum]
MPRKRIFGEFSPRRDSHRDATKTDSQPALSGVTAHAPGSAEEAEAQAAREKARADDARTRAQRLRRRAQTLAAQGKVAAGSQGEDGDRRGKDNGDLIAVDYQLTVLRRHRRWRLFPRLKTVAEATFILFTCALLATSGYIEWRHRAVLEERYRSAEFSAAARQSVVTLMSIDAAKASGDVQRILDNSTGKFKDHLQESADGLIKAVERSKVTTKVTVKSVAVESMTDDSAVVLVAATSELLGAGKPDPPRSWRVDLTLKRVDGRLKISDVDFLQ